MTSEAQGTVINISGKVIALIAVIIVVTVVSVIVLLPLFQSNNNSVYSQVETLELANEHVWYNQTGWFEAAIVVVNTGEKDTVLRKIAVRSIESPWNDIYYWKTDMGPPSSVLKQTLTELLGSAFDITIDGTQRTFQQASAELELKSGWTIVLYIRNPGNLTLNDVSLSPKATIAVFSENKLYYKEATIDLTFTFMKTEELKITNLQFLGTTSKTMNVTVTNPGTSKVTITTIRVNDVAITTTITGSLGWAAGNTHDLAFSYTWTSGNKYKVTLLSSSGTMVAAYESTA